MKKNKMDSEYHTETELKEIQKWNIKDAHNLIKRLKKIWRYKCCFVERWKLDHIYKDRPILNLELHTAGYSGNEDIIKALQKHKLFWLMWWSKTERGGHYYFEIDYYTIGFKKVRLFAKENNITRQYVSKVKDKFEWIKISHGKRLIRAVGKI
ncbi:MAG: hypothetical protein IT275_11200 [Chitinophagales bacterium]|nr:hypothetical protein [Chitinophagales bacterium]